MLLLVFLFARGAATTPTESYFFLEEKQPCLTDSVGFYAIKAIRLFPSTSVHASQVHSPAVCPNMPHVLSSGVPG